MSDLKNNLEACKTLFPAVGGLNPRDPGLRNQLIQFIKRLMRRSLSWYTRPIQLFEGAVIRSLDGLTEQAEKSRQLESSWRHTVPAFLNAVSTVNAFGYELVKLRKELEQRVASARQEFAEHSQQECLSLRRDMENSFQSQRQESEQRSILLRRDMENSFHAIREEMRQDSEQRLESLRTGLQESDASIMAIWERIEFVRCEMMYEMKYGRQTLQAAPGLNPVDQKIISLKKVASARRQGLKLNLGCGHLPLEGYVNVDRRELPGVDVVADVENLRFDEGSVQEIFSAHLLEHFPEEMLRRRLIPAWQRLLAPGGILKAVVPDGEAMLAGVAAGTYSFSNFREVLFGSQEYDGDFHFNLFTPSSLCKILEEAGFSEIRVNARARSNGKCFECEVSAVKVSGDEVPSRTVAARQSEKNGVNSSLRGMCE